MSELELAIYDGRLLDAGLILARELGIEPEWQRDFADLWVDGYVALRSAP